VSCGSVTLAGGDAPWRGASSPCCKGACIADARGVALTLSTPLCTLGGKRGCLRREGTLQQQVRAICDIANAMERAQAASRLASEYQGAMTELSRVRREALEELVAQGKTHAELAEHLGMTRSRIGQLLSSGPRPERAFLGNGPLTIALGGKLEAKDKNPGPVVAQEDLTAYESFVRLAKSYGLEAGYEVIPPPGMINLNRENLTVICGPRISPLIAQVLAADESLGFDKDELGWFLVDRSRGETYRSPMDSGRDEDYAYFGRLPRLDAKGSFLYIAGIHAIGAAGVVHYMEGHMAEMYKKVKDRRFSTVVKCGFNSERKIVTSERVAPIYTPDGEVA
jgi:hypothetical protein